MLNRPPRHTSFLKAEYSDRDGLFYTTVVSKSIPEIFLFIAMQSKNLFDILKITTILVIVCSSTSLIKMKKFKPKKLDFDR